MIAQIDLENGTIVHKWDSVEKIRQNTSYSADRIKNAIEKKEPYGEYLWLNYCKK